MIYVTTTGYQSGAIHKAKDYGIEPYIIKNIDDNSGSFKMLLFKFEINVYHKYVVLKQNTNEAILLGDKYKLCDGNKVITDQDFIESIKRDKSIFKYLEVNEGILLNYKKKVYPQYNTTGIFLQVDNDHKYEVLCIYLDADIELLNTENEAQSNKTYSNILNKETLAQISEYEFDIGVEKISLNLVKNEDEYVLHSSDTGIYQTLYALDDSSAFEIKEMKIQTDEVRNLDIKNEEYRCASNITIPISETQHLDILDRRDKHKLNVFLIVDPNDKSVSIQIPIKLNNNKMFTGKFPEPLRLYINTATDFHNIAERIKGHISTASTQDNVPLIYSDGDYYRYIQYKISSLLMLKSAIEFHLNGLIPNGFEFEEWKGKTEIINNLSIEKKINEVLLKTVFLDFTLHKELIDNIVYLCNLSNEMQNLESSEDKMNHPYYDTFSRLLALDMEDEINKAKSFFQICSGVILM